MKKEIVITGVAGFIGYSVSKRLLDLGYTIIGIDNLNDCDVSLKEYRLKILNYYGDKFVFYKEDISDMPSMKRIFNTHPSPDKIIHFASQDGDLQHFLSHPEKYTSTNFSGFTNIIELARQNDTPFIYASSSSVYGNSLSSSFSETDETSQAVNIEAATKQSNEVLAHSYSLLFNLPTVGLRFFSVYGPWGRPDMSLSKFTKNILAGDKIDVYNNGEMFRDFTYIDDIVSGVLGALDYSLDSYETPFEIFNLGCGNTRKLIDFVNFIELYCDKEAKINFIPMQAWDVTKTSADISKAKKLLNFDPKVNIEDGLQRSVEWYKSFYKVK